MTTYKEALKKLLENDFKLGKMKGLKNSQVTFKTPPMIEKQKRAIKRKNVTPYRTCNVESEADFSYYEHAITTNSQTLNHTPDIKCKGQRKMIEFNVSNDAVDSFNYETEGSTSDWINEKFCDISPSVSEFSINTSEDSFNLSSSDELFETCNSELFNICDSEDLLSSYQQLADVNQIMDISMHCNNLQSIDLSHIFDDTSSDSSSELESYEDLFPKDGNSFLNNLEKKQAEEIETESPKTDSCQSHEEDLYNNIIWEVPGGSIIILQTNSPLYFHGAFILSVLYGAVDILGYTLTPSSSEIEVFSLRGSSYLFFENTSKLEEYNCEQIEIKKLLIDFDFEDHIVEKIMDKLLPSTAIIYCKTLESQSLQFLEKYVAQQLFPKPNGHELLCTFHTQPSNWNVLKINNGWYDVIHQINKNSRVMLCGGKGVGKSTLLRFLINKLLMSYEKILVIDLDPGQPEFTVSGCISAGIVTKPIFGTNYTHLKIPNKCVFVKDINISHDPNEYVNCVIELLNECKDLPKDVPTIINYMGYSRGLGIHLISSIIPIVFPTLVVQIQSDKRQRNFNKKLTPNIIQEYSQLLNINFVNEWPICYDLIEIESMTDECEGWQMEPRIIRELGVLSYFSNMLGPNNLCLTSHKVPMYRINLSDIAIISGENVNSLATINANMVALCAVLGRSKIFKCYGWGIIRGIDSANNELYLLTPLPGNELENVTHLILGSVNLPPAVYMAQDDKLGIVPYVSRGLITDFNTIPKRSYLPKTVYTSNVT